MKLKLSSSDKVYIKVTEENSQIVQYLKNKERFNFNVGDILIRKTIDHWNMDDKPIWRVETVNTTNSLPRRYVCVHKNDFGVCYIKKLKVSDGELGEEIFCLASSNVDNEIYEVDPLFLDSMLLADGCFDIKALQRKEKERKKEITQFNKDSVFKSEKISEINSFLSQFKKGDTFYRCYARNFLGTNVGGYGVLSIKEKYISKMSSSDKELYCEHIDNKRISDSLKFIHIQCDDGTDLNSFDFIRDHLYKNKPRAIMGDET